MDDPQAVALEEASKPAGRARPVIRKATIVDIDRIVELVGHFITETRYTQFLAFKPKALQHLTRQVLQHGILFVAEVDDHVVGLIAAFPMIEPIAGQKQIDELVWWVEPAYRSGSVGPRLLRSLEMWAHQKGLQTCKMVAPWGSDVGRFYERRGYVPVETSYLKRLR